MNRFGMNRDGVPLPPEGTTVEGINAMLESYVPFAMREGSGAGTGLRRLAERSSTLCLAWDVVPSPRASRPGPIR